MFDGITDAAYSFSDHDGVTTVTFDADLSETQAADVWWRMTSRSDADEARRRALAAALEAEGVDPLVADLARYVLGLPGADDDEGVN